MDVHGTRIKEAIGKYLALGYAHTCRDNLRASIPDSCPGGARFCAGTGTISPSSSTLDTSVRGHLELRLLLGSFHAYQSR